MSAAIWSLIGTVVGASIAAGGNWLMHRIDRDERAQRERREAAVRARDERKVAYIGLLSAARRLRYRARPGSAIKTNEIEEIKSDFSIFHYEIELIAPDDIVSCSDRMVRKVLDYITLAIEGASAADHAVHNSADLKKERLETRKAVNEFLLEARADLGQSRTGIESGITS